VVGSLTTAATTKSAKEASCVSGTTALLEASKNFEREVLYFQPSSILSRLEFSHPFLSKQKYEKQIHDGLFDYGHQN